MANGVYISAAVEGAVDEAVVKKLIAFVGANPGDVYGKRGKDHLREKIRGYNNAARYSPWLVLVDLDTDADCAPPLRNAWLPAQSPLLCFRVAVREVEAWLFSDREQLGRCLSVRQNQIPQDSEAVAHPKIEMVNIARRSRRKDIVADMVPRPEGGRKVGSAYASRLVEFVVSAWRPDVAAARSDSLRRAIECLRRLAAS
jgi:hypothetical protein